MFTISKNLRIAGSIIILIGFFMSNWSVIILGNVAVIIGYMWSVGKMEQILESFEEKEK